MVPQSPTAAMPSLLGNLQQSQFKWPSSQPQILRQLRGKKSLFFPFSGAAERTRGKGSVTSFPFGVHNRAAHIVGMGDTKSPPQVTVKASLLFTESQGVYKSTERKASDLSPSSADYGSHEARCAPTSQRDMLFVV